MIIVIDREHRASLKDPQDFRRFEIVVESSATTVPLAAEALKGLGEFDGDFVWISEPALLKLAGRQEDADWMKGFSAMKDYARRFGWVDDERSAIRAHVKWP